MNELEPKSKPWFKKPDTATGNIVGLGLLGLGGWYVATHLPTIINLLQNVIYAGILGGIILFVLYSAYDPKVRSLVWYLYKSFWRLVVSQAIELDPVNIVKSRLEKMISHRDEIGEQAAILKTQSIALAKDIEKNEELKRDSLAIASKYKQKGNMSNAGLKAQMADRLNSSNEELIDLKAKVDRVLVVVLKLYDQTGIIIEDTKQSVDLILRQRAITLSAHAALSSVAKIIKGDEDSAIFDEAMQFIADDMAKKIGEMETFMDLSKGKLDELDLSSEIFTERGLKLLDRFEKGDSVLSVSVKPPAQIQNMSAGQALTGMASVKKSSRYQI